MKSEQKPFRCVRVCAKPLNKGECGRGNQLVNGNDEPSRWIAVIAAEIPAIDELYFAHFLVFLDDDRRPTANPIMPEPTTVLTFFMSAKVVGINQ
jgi:hypothetical protein